MYEYEMGGKKMKHEDMLNYILKANPEFHEEYEKNRLLISFCDEIISLRNEKGISQEELAHRIGTKRTNISRIESGKQNLTLEMMYKLVKALDGDLFITAHGKDFVKLSKKAKFVLEELKSKTQMNDEKIIEQALFLMYNTIMKEKYEEFEMFDKSSYELTGLAV